MPELEVNGTVLPVNLDETILDAIRRANGQVFIGYTCGGNGACQTCQMIVHEGTAFLSEPNRTELAWLTPTKRKNNYRLACQAKVVQDGTVIVTTQAQMIIDTLSSVFNKTEEREDVVGPDPKAISKLINIVGHETLSHFTILPSAAVNSAVRLADGDYTPNMILDGFKAFREQLPDVKPTLEKLLDTVKQMPEAPNMPNMPKMPQDLPQLPQPIKPLSQSLAHALGGMVEAGNAFVKQVRSDNNTSASNYKQ